MSGQDGQRRRGRARDLYCKAHGFSACPLPDCPILVRCLILPLALYTCSILVTYLRLPADWSDFRFANSLRASSRSRIHFHYERLRVRLTANSELHRVVPW
jgi:hypothetical protein